MGNIIASSWFKYGIGAVGGVVATLTTQKAWSFFSKPNAIPAPGPKVVTFDSAKFAALTPEQQQIAVNQAVAMQAAQVS